MWNINDCQYLIYNYGKIPVTEISKVLQKTEKSVREKGRRMGLKTNFTTQKYHINKNIFNKLSNESCYWAGFIAADGHMSYSSKNSVRLMFGQNQQDKELLLSFKRFAQSTHPIKLKKENIVALEINNINAWIPYLKKYYNLIPNDKNYKKTYDLVSPNLTDINHKLSFIIGYIDGDGSITNKNVFRFSIYGTPKILNWISETLYLIEDKHKYPKTAKTTIINNLNGSLSYTYNRAKKIYNILTTINLDYKLKRKWSY